MCYLSVVIRTTLNTSDFFVQMIFFFKEIVSKYKYGCKYKTYIRQLGTNLNNNYKMFDLPKNKIKYTKDVFKIKKKKSRKWMKKESMLHFRTDDVRWYLAALHLASNYECNCFGNTFGQPSPVAWNLLIYLTNLLRILQHVVWRLFLK